MAEPVVTSDGWTPSQLEAAARQREAQRGYPSGGLVALIKQESHLGLNQEAHAASENSHASGPFQIQPGTVKALGYAPSDVYSGAKSLDMASALLDKALAGNGGNWGDAVRQYYAGSPTAARSGDAQGYGKAVANQTSDDDLIAQGTDFNGGGHSSPYAAPSGGNTAPVAEKSDDDLINEGTDFRPKVSADGNLIGQGIDAVAGAASPDAATVPVGSIDPKTGAIDLGNLNDPKPVAPDPTINHDDGLQNIGEGAKQSIRSGFQSLNNIAARVDQAVPALNKLDLLAGTGFTPGQNALQQAQYDQQKAYSEANFASPQYSVGKVLGSGLFQAPILGAGGNMLSAALRGGAGAIGAGAESAEPAINFLSGNAGMPVRNAAGVVTQAGSLPVRLASIAAQGAPIGAVNALTSVADNPNASITGQALTGAELGAAGSVAGNVAGRVASGIGNAVAPTIDAGTAKLVNLAEQKYGMNLRGSQFSSPLIQRIDAQAVTNPLVNFHEQDAANARQFTQAVGNTFGHNGTSITPESFTQARRAIGQRMNDLQKRTPVPYDDGMQSDFAQIEHDAPGVLGPNELAPVTYQLNNIVDKAARNGGTIPGETYQALTQTGSPLDTLISSDDPAKAAFGMRIRNAIDDAQERAADPADIKALQAARLQYKNAMTVAPIVAKSTDGTISPALLKQRVATVFGNSNLGQGDLGELGDIGKRLLGKPSDSGTAANTRAAATLSNIAAVSSIPTAIAMHSVGIPLGVDLAAAGGMAGLGAAKTGANALLAKTLGGQGYKNLLLNKALNDNPAFSLPMNFAPRLGSWLSSQGSNQLTNRTAPAR